MKLCLLLIVTLIFWQTALAEFNDPMRPPAYALEKFRQAKMKDKVVSVSAKKEALIPEESWVLNSILYSSQRQHAIINNQLVKVGDTIKGAKLISLKPDVARLLSKGKIIKLKVYESHNNLKSIRKSLYENKI